MLIKDNRETCEVCLKPRWDHSFSCPFTQLVMDLGHLWLRSRNVKVAVKLCYLQRSRRKKEGSWTDEWEKWGRQDVKGAYSVSLASLTLENLVEHHVRDGEEVPGLAQAESTLTLTGAGIFTEAVSKTTLTSEGTIGVGAVASLAQSG